MLTLKTKFDTFRPSNVNLNIKNSKFVLRDQIVDFNYLKSIQLNFFY